MKLQSSLVLAAGLVIGFLVFGLLPSQSARGQAAPPLTGGNFQISVKGTGADTVSNVFVIDTQTGHCWYKSTHHTVQEWTDLGAPKK